MNNWKSILIASHVPLIEAINVLDKGGLQIVIVVEENMRLLGTLTDGDIRRALLKQLPMSTPCNEIMNKDPETAHESATIEDIVSRMERRHLLHIPIVDDNYRIVDLKTLRDILQPARRGNPVFLMAGGFGKRLNPLTNNCPKPLLKVGGKSIIETIIESFVTKGFYRFFISTHYLSEMIREQLGDGSRWNIELEYIYEDEPLGTGGALCLLPKDRIQESMIMMNGDLLTNLDFNKILDFHNEHESVATICVRNYEHIVPYGVIESDGQYVTSMIEKPVYQHFINAGIYVLSPSIFEYVEVKQRIDMPTLLKKCIESGDLVKLFLLREYWLDIGRMEDFNKAQVDIETMLNE